MNRRNAWFAGAALLLIVLNVMQWWSPASSKRTALPATSAAGFRPEDFRLKIGAESTQSTAVRDIFRLPLPPAPLPVKKAELPSAPPPKTAEQLAEEAARAEFAQLKLVGVVFRGGQGQAFVVNGDRTFLVRSGEKVGERFVVQSISTDSVTLNDPRTNVTGQIPVSGK